MGLDDGEEWYQAKPHDDYGNELNGRMHYSLFTQDYRDNFLEVKGGEEIQEQHCLTFFSEKQKFSSWFNNHT